MGKDTAIFKSAQANKMSNIIRYDQTASLATRKVYFEKMQRTHHSLNDAMSQLKLEEIKALCYLKYGELDFKSIFTCGKVQVTKFPATSQCAVPRVEHVRIAGVLSPPWSPALSVLQNNSAMTRLPPPLASAPGTRHPLSRSLSP